MLQANKLTTRILDHFIWGKKNPTLAMSINSNLVLKILNFFFYKKNDTILAFFFFLINNLM